MVKGGYTIIDFENKNLTSSASTAVVINGIHNAVEVAKGYGKPLLLSGLHISADLAGVWCQKVGTSSTSFTLKIEGYTLTVTSDNKVYYTSDE